MLPEIALLKHLFPGVKLFDLTDIGDLLNAFPVEPLKELATL
jgi:hypothetical protein